MTSFYFLVLEESTESHEINSNNIPDVLKNEELITKKFLTSRCSYHHRIIHLTSAADLQDVLMIAVHACAYDMCCFVYQKFFQPIFPFCLFFFLLFSTVMLNFWFVLLFQSLLVKQPRKWRKKRLFWTKNCCLESNNRLYFAHILFCAKNR